MTKMFAAVACATVLTGAHAQAAQGSMKFCGDRVQLTQFTRAINDHGSQGKILYSAWVKNLTDKDVDVSSTIMPFQSGLRDISSGAKPVLAHKRILLRIAEWSGPKDEMGEGHSDYVLSLYVKLICAK